MADDTHLIEQATGDSTLLHRGFLELRRDAVRLPDGSTSTREYVRHEGAVAIVPVLDDGQVVLVRQFRYPVGAVLLELPAGKVDIGETPWASAQRELQEETGFRARQWAYGGEVINAAAYSSERIHVWLARDLVPGPQRLDEGEFLEVATMTAEELERLSAAGLLPDAKTVFGLNRLRQWRVGAWLPQWRSGEAAAAADWP